jgi:HK97 family phage major capsid protein/HK97 family phage prohead protease
MNPTGVEQRAEGINLMPTDGMREEAQRYRDWKAEGRRGGTSVAARRASQILSGDALSPSTVITMAAWFARHEVDKKGQGFSPSEDGYPSPGRVAWAAWGGDAGQTWATAKAAAIKKAAGRLMDMSETPIVENEGIQQREMTPDLTAPQVALYEALEEIVDELGPFDQGIGAHGSHYMPVSPFAAQGMQCSNCVFYAGAQACEIVAGDIAPEGACKFWIIPEELLGVDSEEPLDGQTSGEQIANDQMAGRAMGDQLKVGDYCRWNSSGGMAQGRIERIERNGKINVPDSSFEIEGTADDPAALVRVYQEGADGWEPSDTQVGHKLSTLSKIEPLREEQSEDVLLRDMEARGTRVQRREMTAELVAQPGGQDELRFSFSSEQPVERYFGTEVLSHDAGAADLSRLNSGAPFLWNHDRDAVIGVVEGAELGNDRRGYCTVKWSRNTMAQEKRQDVEDGILRNVSFAYSIDKVEEHQDQMVVTKWTPLEVSLVSIPADNTVGLGRAYEEGDSITEGSTEPQTDSEVPEQGAKEASAAPAASPKPLNEESMDNTPDVEVIRSEAAKAERARVASINALGEKLGMADLARELIDGGRSLDEARAAFLDKQTLKADVTNPIASQAREVGLTDKETRQFSFVRALNYLVNPSDAKARQAAAFEIEVGEAAAKKYERSSNGIVIPNEVLRRDLVVGTSTAGGNLVAPELLSGSFIDLLRNRMAMMQAGVTMLSGLQGNIAIPRQSSAATAYWVGENASPTESQQAIDQVNMTPKTVGAYVDYSRRLLLQASVDVEAMVRNDLARVIALELDRAAIYGTGSTNQPLGLVNTTGIGSQTITTYGTFAEYIGMETKVAVANADAGAMRYIINANARGALKGTEKSATSTAQFVYADDEINGYSVIVSNQLGTNDCLFGDFSQFIVGMWSGLDLTVDPYAGSTAGTVRIIALQDVDFAVKQPGAFVFGT